MKTSFHKWTAVGCAALFSLNMAAVVSAADKNEITLVSDKTSLTSGESFEVAVGFSPDDNGAAGFVVDLHYDTKALTLIAPCAEKDTSFSISANCGYSDGVVRISCVRLDGKNVLSEEILSRFKFKVNDGFTGDSSIYATVSQTACAYGGSFVKTDFTTDEITINAEKTTDRTTSVSSEPTKTSVGKTPESSAVTSAEQTTGSSSQESSAQTTSLTASLPEQVIPQTTVLPSDGSEKDEPKTELFSYKQGKKDFNSEKPVQFTFSPDAFSEALKGDEVNLKVNLSSSGAVRGGIGMAVGDEWKSFSYESYGGDDVWEIDSIDLSKIRGDISVQLYYLKANSEFKVNSVEITDIHGEKFISESEFNTIGQAAQSGDDSKAQPETTTTQYVEPEQINIETTTTESVPETIPVTQAPKTTAETQKPVSTTTATQVSTLPEQSVPTEKPNGAGNITTVTNASSSDKISQTAKSYADEAAQNPKTGAASNKGFLGLTAAALLMQGCISGGIFVKRKRAEKRQ